MFELDCAVEGVEPQFFAAAPVLTFKLRIRASNPEQEIYSILLKNRIQIEATRRQYTTSEQEHLIGLFGEPERWSEIGGSLLWMDVDVMVPPFRGETLVELHVPCTFDFNVAATKYFYLLQEGDIPLGFLFSGSIFYAEANGALHNVQIPWGKEAVFGLPVAIWKQMMDHYYPNTAWICIQREVFDQLLELKVREGFSNWEQVLESLLGETQPSEPTRLPK